MPRIRAKHHLRETGLTGAGLAKNTNVVRFPSTSGPASEMFEPHWVHHVICVGTAKINDLLLVTGEYTIKQRLIDAVNPRSGGRDEAQYFRIETILAFTEGCTNH